MKAFSIATALIAIVAGCLASDSPRDNFRVDVNLVRVAFVAVGEGSKTLRDITREELRVSDNGVPQDVKYLWRETDLPLSIAFLIDIGELEGKKTAEKFKDVVREFIGSAIGPDDSGLLATLDTQARIVSDAGSSKEQLLRAIDQIQYEGNAGVPIGEPCLPPPSPPLRRPGTECVGRPLWDTIFHIAGSKLTGTQKRKAIVVFTDGYDLGSSVHGLSSAIEAAESAGITVYTVRYEAFCAPTGDERRLSPVLGDRGMQEIAEATGGRAFKQPRRFDAVYRQIEEDLRSQYVLAFTPGNPGAHGTWHRLNVQIARPRAQVRAPARYRVP